MKSYSQSEIERFAKIINANKSVIDKLSNVERVDAIEAFKKGNKIHIKKENRGKFTDYCGGKVTSECIQRGKNSSDPKIRKRATFAANARKWKHQSGGILEDRSAEKQKYDEWNQLPAIDKLKRNFTIAKQFISESPKAENVYNAIQALFGNYNPQNPYLITGVAPSVGRKQSVSNINDKGLQITRKFKRSCRRKLQIC